MLRTIGILLFIVIYAKKCDLYKVQKFASRISIDIIIAQYLDCNDFIFVGFISILFLSIL